MYKQHISLNRNKKFFNIANKHIVVFAFCDRYIHQGHKMNYYATQ